MKGAVRLGSIFGVEIRVHWTFSLLLAWLLWVMRDERTEWVQLLLVLMALFACVVLHELAHSVVARRFGGQVQGITLLPIGGVALMRRMPEKALHEFLTALAGPLVNLSLFVLLWLVREHLTKGTAPALLDTESSIDLLMRANLVMALFNLIPAFPMDGGRILRSLLRIRMSRARATWWAALLGRMWAAVFIAVGFWLNPILALIGVFVFLSAGREEQMVRTQDALRPFRVRDAMLTPPVSLRPDEPLARCRELAIQRRQEDFVLEADGRLVGLLPRADWAAALRELGDGVPVGQVARRHFFVLRGDAPLEQVFREMLRSEQQVFPVVEEGRLVGLLSLEDIGRFLALRGVAELPGRRPQWRLDVG